MDLSHRRLSSTDNVGYVSENNLQQILLSIVGYHGNGPKNDQDPRKYDNLKNTKKLFLIETLSLIIT